MLNSLFSAFAASTLVSQSLMDLFAILMVLHLSYIYFRWRQQGRQDRFWNPVGFDFLFVLWAVVVALSFISNLEISTDWLGRIFEFKWVLFFYCLVLAFRITQPTEKILPWVCLLVSLFSIYAIFVFFLGWDPIKGPDFPMTVVHGGVRTGGLYSNPMMFAHAYGMTFCLLLGPSIYFLRWKQKLAPYMLATLTLLAAAVICSFTRGAWAGLAAAVLVIAFMVSRRLGMVTIGLGGLGLVLLSALWEGFRARVLMSFQFGNNYDSERVWIWKANWEMFRDHPLLGVGYWNNSKIIPEYYERIGAPSGLLTDHAHNQYLHWLSGTGVLGLTVYLAVLVCFLVLSIKVWRAISESHYWHKGLALGAIGMQIFFWVGGITEGNFEHSKIKYILSLNWALVVWLAYEYRVLRERL